MATSADIERGSGGTGGRQSRTLIGVASAHWLSHVHIMVLPPLFPVLNTQLGLSYIQLGLAMTLFGIVSGLTQAPMGALVDRFGARRILLAGLCIGGAAFMVIGIHPTYPTLLACATVAGLANSVYHPADYALLSTGVDERRMGRAFSIHTFAGFLGGAVTPVMMALIVARFDVQTALIAAGALGPLVAVFLVLIGLPDSRAATDPRHGPSVRPTTFRDVCSPAILMLAVFFILLGLSTGGINSFGVSALITGYDVDYQTASLAITLFLGFSATGVLAGGFLADKTDRHGLVAAGCFALNAVVVFAIAFLSPAKIVLMTMLSVAGFLGGLIAPSRDMLVRKAAPAGAAGRAFGIVSTGFNIGSVIGPMIYGYIMDLSLPRVVFMVSACFMIATVLLALATERREAPARP